MMFYCQHCDQEKDGDSVESYEWEDGHVCIDCHTELESQSFELVRDFYRDCCGKSDDEANRIAHAHCNLKRSLNERNC